MSRFGAPADSLYRIYNSNVDPVDRSLPVPRLALDGMQFEVDAVAVLD